MKKVGVSKEEKQLSYYRFFEQDLAEIPEEKLQILKGGPSQIKAVPFEEKNLFLAGKDEAYCQIGYGIMEDGTGFVFYVNLINIFCIVIHEHMLIFCPV